MKITIDLSDITSSLGKELEAELQQAEDVAGKVALDFHRGVKRRTPRDTGTAANGWDVDLTGSMPIVQNNVSYIGALNRGHSKQAPAGFVEAELDAAMRRTLR